MESPKSPPKITRKITRTLPTLSPGATMDEYKELTSTKEELEATKKELAAVKEKLVKCKEKVKNRKKLGIERKKKYEKEKEKYEKFMEMITSERFKKLSHDRNKEKVLKELKELIRKKDVVDLRL